MLLAVPRLSAAETTILEGKHRVILDIINPAGVKHIPDYKNANFSQKVLETKSWTARVEITIGLDPFRSSASYPLSVDDDSLQAFLKPEAEVQSNRPEIQQQARELVGYAATEVEAVQRIARWMADNIRYEVNTPQDAAAVYRTRAGSCAGQTRLMMAMLRTSGIPARYVRGFLPPGDKWGFDKEYWGVTIKSGGFHAWIEIYFPDQGWVFSDILHSLFFVDPHHLLMQITGTDLNPSYETTVTGEDGNIRMEEGTSFTIYKEDDQSRIVDALPEPKRLLLSRRTGPQVSCAISGEVKDPAGKPVKSGDFILWQGGQGKVYPLSKKGRFGMAGFERGNYAASVRAPGFAEARKNITFEELGLKEVNFQLEPGGVISGRITDASGQGIPGAWVYLWQGSSAKGYPTDDDGRYEVVGCPVGLQRLSAEGKGYQKAEAKIEVKAGAKVEKNWALKQ
jgi:protocatechuate 3,4-dioxygenase beta subunit